MIELLVISVVSVVQNAAFTGVSRSRNSGDVGYHFRWALASNGIWFVNMAILMRAVWSGINEGQWWYVILAGCVYTVSCSVGSALMMRYMLRAETGKRQVGAR